MALEFRLPDVGEGLHEAEIVRWLVKEGDLVAADQPLVEVQTDKVSVEIPSPRAGKILKLFGKEGDIVQVGAVIAVIGDPDEVYAPGAAPAAPAAPPAEAAPAPAAPAVDAAPAQAAPAAAPGPAEAPAAAPAAPAAAPAPTAAPAAQTGRRPLATPATRRLARELGVDLRLVPPTGPGGRVTSEDVRRFAAARAAGQAAPAQAPAPGPEAAPAGAPTPAPAAAQAPGEQVPTAPAPAAAAPAPAPAAEERIPLRGVRRAIAEAMVRSKRTAPHVTLMDEVEVSDLVAFRARAKELAAQKGVKLTYLPFIVKALVPALKEFPYLNARLDDERQEIVLVKEYNIGIAVDTEQGLMVPVVKGVDRKSIFTIAREIQDLSTRARENRLTLEDLRGGTFSISNMGAIGSGTYFTPIINHPEVAILGVGSIAQKPVVRDGQLAVGQVLHLSLSFDHRVVDGAYAGRFLKRVAELLANPTQLLMEA